MLFRAAASGEPLTRDLSFSDFRVGMLVQVKNSEKLQSIFNSPLSQWSKNLGPRVRHDTAPRMNAADRVGPVASVDTADNTVQVEVDGKKAWFTPGPLNSFL